MNVYWKEKFYIEFSDRLQQVMKQKQFTIYKLKKESGVQYTTIDRMLKGHPFQFHYIIGISFALGVSIDELLKPMKEPMIRYVMTEGKNVQEEINQLV